MGKGVFLKNGNRTLDTSVLENEIRPLSYSRYKNQLNMDERLKHKIQNSKVTKRNPEI
jgi:hypothetical protein